MCIWSLKPILSFPDHTLYYIAPIKGKDDEQEFFLTKEMTRQKPNKPSMSKSENEEVLVDSTPSILPKKTLIEKPESVGVLSHDKEGIADPQDEIVLSVYRQDVEDRQVQSQGRRLDAAALQAFKNRCDATNLDGLSGSDAYVDCVSGYVNGDSSTSCATACIVNGESKCCTGPDACAYFTGKGKNNFD